MMPIFQKLPLQENGWSYHHEKDKVQECYEPGVTCPNCHDIKSEKKKSGLRERQKQALLNFMRKKRK